MKQDLRTTPGGWKVYLLFSAEMKFIALQCAMSCKAQIEAGAMCVIAEEAGNKSIRSSGTNRICHDALQMPDQDLNAYSPK